MKENRRKIAIMFLAICLVISITGCGSSSMNSSDSIGSSPSAPSMPKDNYKSVMEMDSERGDSGSSTIAIERKLIETVSLTLEVENVFDIAEEISVMTKQLNGFVQESRTWEGNNAKHGYLTARIPADRLNTAIEQIETLGLVHNKQRNIDDVTEKYFDREARLRNLEAQEKRYLEILAEAKTTEDVINVERELVSVREQIEVYTGQLNYLDHQISFSTLNIQLEEQKTISQIEKPSFIKAFESAKVAFKNSINMILTTMTGFIILIGYLIPLLPILLILAYIYYRRHKKIKSKKADVNG